MSSLRPFDLVIPFTIKKGEVTGEVRMPSGKVAQPAITDNKDGTVTVRYAPSEAGLHEMDIRYDNMHIPGSPYSSTWIMSTVAMSQPMGQASPMGW